MGTVGQSRGGLPSAQQRGPVSRPARCLTLSEVIAPSAAGPSHVSVQLYLDEGYAYVAMDTLGMGQSEGVWDPVSRTEGEAIHDMIEHVAGLDWSTGKIGIIGMSHYC